MKAAEANEASQRGILKAGLEAIGYIRLINPPLASSFTIISHKLERNPKP
jgi:hypothetical protein